MLSLTNPWVLLGMVGVIIGAFFYGIHLEHGRFVAFETAVAAEGKLQEERTKTRIEKDKRVKKEIDDAHARVVDSLSTNIAALVDRLLKHSSGSVLPSVPAGTPVSDTICFDRDQLDGALRGFTAGTAGLLGEGEKARLDLACGIRWVQEESKPATR